jgi:hypothetical protein
MHRAIAFFAAACAVASAAHADVGPPPSCPPGTHHVYLYGHKCVPDGSHLERDPNGGVVIVKDGEVVDTGPPKLVETAKPAESAKPAATSKPAETASAVATAPKSVETPQRPELALPALTASAANPAPAAPASNSPDAPPPSEKGCTCGIPDASDERIGFGLVIGAMVFAASRRIRSDRARR